MTHNELCQRGYWIVGGSSAISSFISRCITCQKLRKPLQQQKMAELPEDRLEPAATFSYCAVDYFGPFMIKERRSEVKCYEVLFTCMASRSVHLETANSLNTSSFINALTRFFSCWEINLSPNYNGSSTVDYIITETDCFDKVRYFQVLPLTLFSEHCPIIANMDIKSINSK